MYTSRGTNSYGQQSYNAQSAYGQNPASTFPGNPAGGAGSSSQLTLTPRHASILGGHLESEIGGFRGHPSAAQYGGQYASLYGQTSVSAGQQGATISALSGKGSGPSPMEGRTSYGPAVADSPKYSAKDYVAASSHGYGHKSELLMPDKMAEYASLERRQFAERQGAYVGRDLPVEAGGRYADSAGYKSEMYDRLDQASILRQDQMLKSQSLQSTPHERQADYLAARSGTFRHPTQELASYGGRLEADPRASVVGNSLYGGQPAPSILGAAPQRNVDDLVYAQTPTNPGYGVSLPPGRDYGMGKGLHGTALESDFPGSLSSRSGLSRVEDQKDDRYSRELDIRDEERRRERLRDREREREREHEREREKERERERERKRLLEIREKERERDRDRERKRATESRRERSQPRSSKDRRGSSLTKDGKSSRRDSPRREALHRIHSPVKEKRRDYVCKVYTSCLVHVERDYLSLDKRYPRLYISPDFSKVVVNWPRENLKLPMHTPVSFEHDLVEVESSADGKEPSTRHSDVASTPEHSSIASTPEHSSIVWNAKMILMSGLSRSATEDLSSEKLLDERIPHICNLLKFAVLKKDRSLMAIGGPWDPVDGGHPSVDESSLIRTVLRYAKDMSHLDLQNCQHWNRFFEIHYDRIGKDGLFSHREITVFFVPDLSDCLPSLNSWREQWLAHKKAVADREKQLSLVKEKVRDKKVPLKEGSSPRDVNKAEKKKETVSTGQTADVQKEKGGGLQKASIADKDGEGNKKNTEKKEVNELTDEASNLEKKEAGPSSHAQKSTKPAKKKIVRRVVKQKVTDKTVVSGEDANNGMNKLEDKAIEVTGINAGTSGQQDTSPADVTGVKTFTRKKVAKKLSEADADVKVADKESGLKNDKQSVSTEEPVVKSDATAAVVKDGPVKRVVKRKIIKRVPKKKATGAVVNSETSDNKSPVIDADTGDAQVNKEKATEGEKLVISASTTQPGVESSQKVDDAVLSSKTVKSVDKIKGKEEEGLDDKRVSEYVTVKDIHADGKEKSDGKVKVKDGKERKEKDSKDDLKSKSSKDVDRKKSDEPPRHPGFILQTKSGKAAKLRSLSLSLDSLLDYSDKDIEEETFELSVFAESFYEMLQYQMGSRVLSFLQELRIKFIAKRNSRKRQREQNADSKIKEKTATKRSKTEDTSAGEKSSKSQMNDETHSGHEKLITKEDSTVDNGVKSDKTDDTEKMTAKDDEEMVEEEDPEEEDPEEEEEEEDGNEEEEMQDESPQKDSFENQKEGDEQDAKKQTTEDNANGGEKKASGDVEVNKQKEAKDEVLKKASSDKAPVDKELLQAFRFFDRNRVGYIRVEDLRMIIHNLGKFLSHRDVKELVQSALLESNTGRDDRVLYEKLVRMSLNLDQ